MSGADALKLFVGGIAEEEDAEAGDLPNIACLTKAVEAADAAMARAEGAQDSAIEALRRIEQEDAPLAAAEAGATSDLTNAQTQIETGEARSEFATLVADRVRAREDAAEAVVKLEEAKRDATAHDLAVITRKIETIDARPGCRGGTDETRNGDCAARRDS